VSISSPRLSVSKTSPAIVAVTRAPPTLNVTVSPTD
jgi:hypothetical protein